MMKILFVCHGNICRSPMAECVMKDLLAKNDLAGQVLVASAATSTEEIGNPVHPGTLRVLRKNKIAQCGHHAVQMTRADYHDYDLIVGMDSANLCNILKITGGDAKGKVCRLLDFTTAPREIADPWYTGDFDTTFRDVYEGCTALLETIKKDGRALIATNGIKTTQKTMF